MNSPQFLEGFLVVTLVDCLFGLLTCLFSKDDNIPFNIPKVLMIVNGLLAMWSMALVLGANLSIKIFVG